MSADPRVMEFFPAPLDRADSDSLADHLQGLIEARGWGVWALELRATGGFIGFTGLHVPAPQLPFSPCVEIAWRLAHEHWGKGYAQEAARAALAVGFGQLGMQEIVSFTTMANRRSRAVMERLGMREAEPFDHPLLPTESPLRPHVLYRLTRGEWERRVLGDQKRGQ